MAYEKQTWTTGELITAEKLNHMEDGIGGSSVEPITITITYDDDTGTYTANKTYVDFYAEWGNCSDESTDLDRASVPCTITYNEVSSGQSSTTVYNGLAVLVPYSDANPGVGIGLIVRLEGMMEYNEDAGLYAYIKWAYGFIFYQHQADDVIIDIS